ncbi:MAG: hypothetical protein QOI84_1655 [Solirubrobacterales bacterium]|jgi:hypothetical protein|nr:hypothetical protein [Solirubrobacterales bacterium]
MNHTNKRRTGLGGLLALALGAVALLVMAGPAVAKDRNHDHIPDRWEKRHRLSLNVNQARRDQDGDHLRNLAEFRAGDNPRKADSDGDGIPDGEENAGTIASFDSTTGMLVIDLFGTETVSGLVTEETEISCEDSSGSAGTSSDEQSGDDNGDQGQESGDDNGGEEDVGDDNSGPGGDDNGEEGNCTTADLVPGAVVHEADLQVANGTATFDEVDLG